MSASPTIAAAGAPAAGVAVQPAAVRAPDASGRDRLVWNVLASWVGHLVFVVAGFVMPRLIDSHLGQVSLGIWDFGWSIVSYFVLAQVGVGSSVNRYVAKFKAMGDAEGLCRTVSSVNVIQIAATLLTLALTATLAWLLPSLFGERLGVGVTTARWTIGLLGSSIAAQLLFNAFGGVLTGCHRWDIHNGITAGAYGLIVAGMITTLSLGGGLPDLAAVYLAGTIAGELLRMKMAYRTCPELHIHPRLATWTDVKMLLSFGGKTVVDNLARLLLGQANSILVATYLGPAALAVYARPGALLRHADAFTNKFGMVLSPTASSLKSTDQLGELRAMFVQGTRFAVFVAAPVIVFLAMMGDPILQVWMGPRYREGLLMAVVAVGGFLPLTQRPAAHVLIGLNRHGRVGWASFAVACLGVAMAIVALGPMNGGMLSAALALAIPASLGNGLFVMVYACRSVGVPLGQYLRQAFLAPLACVVPHGLALLAVRLALPDRPGAALLLGMAASAAVLGPLYWRLVLPRSLRATVLSTLAALRARVPVARRDRPRATVAVAGERRRPADAPAVAAGIRRLPYPYRAALAICSDLDETPDRRAYVETLRYLNTTQDTAMGSGVGLEVGNTIYFDMPRAQFAYWNTDDAGREQVRELIRSGHVDCLHSFGDFATTREHARRALDELARADCWLRVWLDHAVAPSNVGADIMHGTGDLREAPAYHADLTYDYGIRYVWMGRVTSVLGQGVDPTLRGIAAGRQPFASSRTLLKEAAKHALARAGSSKYAIHAANAVLREVELRSGHRVTEFLRSNPHRGGVSCGDTADGLAAVLTSATLDRLVGREAFCILYTHLGKTRHPSQPIPPESCDALRLLARYRDEGRILVTTTRRLLEYCDLVRRATASVAGVDGEIHVTLRLPRDYPVERPALDGLCLYTSDPSRTRVFAGNGELTGLRVNPPDHTGRASVSCAWPRLEFPL